MRKTITLSKPSKKWMNVLVKAEYKMALLPTEPSVTQTESAVGQYRSSHI
jgi:hypothetical protein